MLLLGRIRPVCSLVAPCPGPKSSRQNAQFILTQALSDSRSRRDRFFPWVVSWLGWLILQFIGRTSRVAVHWSLAAQPLRDDGRPLIFAFWHRHQLLMAWEHRRRGVTVLVSRSRDGELIAGVLERLGYRTARGSSSRGGPAAFMELLDAVAAGGRVAFTPDGPRGPAGSVQPGVLALAAKTGVPIVPVAWAGTRVKTLSSWDRFMIPLPFGRFEVVFGNPLPVSAVNSAAEQNLRRALEGAEAEAVRRLEAPC